MAALVFGTMFQFVGWRGMFVIGALPAFLVIYIRSNVDESPACGCKGELQGKQKVGWAKTLSSFLVHFF